MQVGFAKEAERDVSRDSTVEEASRVRRDRRIALMTGLQCCLILLLVGAIVTPTSIFFDQPESHAYLLHTAAELGENRSDSVEHIILVERLRTLTITVLVLLLAATVIVRRAFRFKMILSGLASDEVEHEKYLRGSLSRASLVGKDILKLLESVDTKLNQVQERADNLTLDHPAYIHCKEAICALSSSQRIVDVNPAYMELTGYTRDELIGRSLASIFPRELLYLGEDGLLSQYLFDGMEREVWGHKKHGSPYRKRIRLFNTEEFEYKDIHSFYVEDDITKAYQEQKQMDFLAKSDPLTGIYNRRKFDPDIAKIKLAEEKGVALCIIGIDRMRRINAEYGLAFGDKVLVEAGRRLVSAVSGTENQVYRLDSDGFIVILRKVHSEHDLERQTRTLHSSLSGKFVSENLVTEIDACIGATTVDWSCQKDVPTYLHHCYLALQNVKNSSQRGSKIVITNDQVISEETRILRISSALASTNLADCLQISYQPTIRPEKSALCGAQAHLSWNHSETGHVSEDELIDIASKSQNLARLEGWMINRVLEGAAEFSHQLRGFQTSIRISEKWMSNPTNASILLQKIRERGIPPGSIAIDVAKRCLVKNKSATTQILTTLRNKGVNIHARVSFADFDTEEFFYTLLVDAIKIDRNYLGGNLNLDAIKKIFSIAKTAKLPVIAEGVDNSYQLDLLRNMGCTFCQGYVYSEPVFVDRDAAKVVSNWRRTADSFAS